MRPAMCSLTDNGFESTPLGDISGFVSVSVHESNNEHTRRQPQGLTQGSVDAMLQRRLAWD